MEVKKNKKDKNSKLYKYVVIYIGTVFMMISPFFIDSNEGKVGMLIGLALITICLLYTSPSPRDISGSRMPSSA